MGILKNYSSRKFLVICIGIAEITIALYTNYITGGEFVTGLVSLIGLYLGANTLTTKMEHKI